jgi:hypothetical protein
MKKEISSAVGVAFQLEFGNEIFLIQYVSKIELKKENTSTTLT